MILYIGLGSTCASYLRSTINMFVCGGIIFWGLVSQVLSASDRFPDGFKFGAATAAFQIEGAWNVSGKSPSIWDNYLHENTDMVNGDVACDSYNLWEEDIKIAKTIGLDYYRISLSWTRLLPSGFSNNISEAGRSYYDNLINGMLAEGIEPVVTIYHWDLPQTIQDLGGWTNPMIADWFAEYARVVFSLFGDRVKTWITINEPHSFCYSGYNSGYHPPSVVSPGIGDYLCVKNVMVAHGKAYRIYEKEFRSKYHGKVGIANHLIWLEPLETVDETTELMRQLFVGLFSHPIYSKDGGWPPALEKIIEKNSLEEGYPSSRLIKFTKSEINMIRGSFDFYGMNHYTSRTVRKAEPGDTIQPHLGAVDVKAVLSVEADWENDVTFWYYIYYEGIRKQLAWLKENYGDIEILITENGFAQSELNLNDTDRIEYMVKIFEQVLLSIHEDGVNVVGYTYWSLMDNLEWSDGYSAKFGLYQIDFEDPELKRVQRDSAKFYADLIQNHSLNISSKYIS